MIAVIKTGGKQYKIKQGDTIRVEKLEVEKDKIFDFNHVLLVGNEKGEDLKIGTPIVEGAKVTAKVLEQGKAKKIDVIKYKRKVRYRKKYGHRQPYTEVKIEKITV
ncbi:MAG: 50S ribosomal protein L21 [Patescibacteria group bacterium]|jgi:large subunit ribosomal protein L21|nr:50S ribosomal protein L21 [Patescibacteria group bacterium]MDP6756205.1 50S ribosomal protein L21 [Patescibacteria group bacterium]